MRVRGISNPDPKFVLTSNHVVGALAPAGLFLARGLFQGIMNPILHVYLALGVIVDNDKAGNDDP